MNVFWQVNHMPTISFHSLPLGVGRNVWKELMHIKFWLTMTAPRVYKSADAIKLKIIKKKKVVRLRWFGCYESILAIKEIRFFLPSDVFVELSLCDEGSILYSTTAIMLLGSMFTSYFQYSDFDVTNFRFPFFFFL